MTGKSSLLVVVVLVGMILAACAGGSPGPATEQPAPATQEEAGTDQPAPTEETASGPSGEPIVIGGSLSLTGPFAATAIIHKIVGEAYVQMLNENGGLLGRPVEWVLLDDESSADKAAALYERLITEDQVDLVIGPYGTGNITAAMQVAERYDYVFPHHTGSLTYAYTYKWQFPTWYTGLHTNQTTPDLLFDALDSTENPPKTIAFVINQFPGTKFLAYGQEGKNEGGAVDIAQEHGYDVVLDVEFPLGTTDFTDIAAQVRDADPDFIYMGALGVDGVNLLNALQTINYQPRGIFMQWPAPGPLVGMGEPANNTLSVTVFEEHEPFLSNPGADELVARFHAGAEAENIPYKLVDVQAAASWAAWQVLITGVEGSGSLDQEAIANYILENGVDSVIGKLTFDPANQNYGPDLQKVKQLQNGVWAVVYPPEFANEGWQLVFPSQ